MTGAQAPIETTMFNNSFLSDVTIRQICNGDVKEYHAHKAILCLHSEWFTTAFSGQFKESSDHIIEVHDDDPVCFEMMLKYFYTHKWVPPPHDTWPEIERPNIEYFAPIRVYALADKYDCGDLRDCAARIFPMDGNFLPNDVIGRMVEAHYDECVEVDCLMGRKMMLSILEDSHRMEDSGFISSGLLASLVKKYPNLASECLRCHMNLFRAW